MSEEENIVEEAVTEVQETAESANTSAASGSEDSQESQERGDGRARRRPMRRRRKVCAFCEDETKPIDFKDVNTLKKYVSERGKILPRRITGNCAKHQRAITLAVKRARHVALMPYTVE